MKPLRNILRLNMATCLVFGVFFLVAPGAVGAFLGGMPILALQVIGAALVLNGIHLGIASKRASIWGAEVFYFAAGDILWFSGSVLVLATGVLITTRWGVYSTLAVAVGVVMIGLRQLWALAETRQSGVAVAGAENPDRYLSAGLSRGRSIAVSWMAIKTWVKIWLFLLNGVFLAALFFWPEPLARYSIAAFVISGPVLFALITIQRGLTRLLGLAHLIPWVPLLAYLGLRLAGSTAGPQITMAGGSGLFVYTCLLAATVAICLAFDVYDLVRWAGGKRGRLGSPSETI